MPSKSCDCRKNVSFSAAELKDVLSLTQKIHYQNSRCRIFSDDSDREKFEAIMIFIEKILHSIRRVRIRKLVTYGAQNITLIRSDDELEFEITFNQKEIKKSVFDKLHNNTKMHMEIKNKKDGKSVLLIMPEKGAKK